MRIAKATLGPGSSRGQPADAVELLGMWLSKALPTSIIHGGPGTVTCAECIATSPGGVAIGTLCVLPRTTPASDPAPFGRIMMQARCLLVSLRCEACQAETMHALDNPFVLPDVALISVARQGPSAIDRTEVSDLASLQNNAQAWNHHATAIVFHNGRELGDAAAHFVTVAKVDDGRWMVFDDDDVHEHRREDGTAESPSALVIEDQKFFACGVLLVRNERT